MVLNLFPAGRSGFKKRGILYERIFSDEELAAMVNGKEIELQTVFDKRAEYAV